MVNATVSSERSCWKAGYFIKSFNLYLYARINYLFFYRKTIPSRVLFIVFFCSSSTWPENQWKITNDLPFVKTTSKKNKKITSQPTNLIKNTNIYQRWGGGRGIYCIFVSVFEFLIHYTICLLVVVLLLCFQKVFSALQSHSS